MKLQKLAVLLCVPLYFCSASPAGPSLASSLLSPIVARLRRAAQPDQSVRQNFFRRFKRAVFAKILKKLADFERRLSGKRASWPGYGAESGLARAGGEGGRGRDAGAPAASSGSESDH